MNCYGNSSSSPQTHSTHGLADAPGRIKRQMGFDVISYGNKAAEIFECLLTLMNIGGGMVISDFDWLVGKLRTISSFGREINDGGITTDYNHHTALKLITLQYVSDVFARVAGNVKREMQGFDGAVYIDLFAGTGLVRVGKVKDIVAGSAICAVKSGKLFAYSILVEKDKQRHDVLSSRMKRVLPKNKFHVIKGDSNEVIGKVIKMIEKQFKNPIVLVFVDPEGMEIRFRTLKTLSDRFQSCDFLINVNAQGVQRVAGQTKSGIPNRAHAIEEYMDEDVQTVLQELAEGKPVEEKYSDQVKNVLGKSVGEVIKIRGDGGRTAYYLLCYTRQTLGGSAYSNAWPPLKKRIENLDGDRVREALDQLNGRSVPLCNYFDSELGP